MFAKLFPKDADETLDYSVDWSGRQLVDDTIETMVIVIRQGGAATVDVQDLDHIPARDEINGFMTSFWLTKGVVGQTYEVEVTITTAAGRVCQETFTLKIVVK